jgi:predicted metal-dependent phosphoesterase TrpH
MGLIDLHIHSTYSDGTMSPAAIVALAKESGIQTISITDHDTMDGVEEALEHGRQTGVEVIPGIEVSTWLENVPMHILGYWCRPDDENLHQRLKKLQDARMERNRQILAKLQALNILISEEELTCYSVHGQAGRPHIAQLMVDKKAVATLEQAFFSYLRRGAAAYAERFKYYADETIDMIREAGGVAILAHPGSLDSTLETTLDLLLKLKKLGLAGVEAYYPTHNSFAVNRIKQMAETLGLVITGGSDFHGSNRSKSPLGGTKKFRIPHQILENLRQ